MRSVAVVVLLALCGCAGGQRARSELEEANDSFARSFRWGDLRSLSQRIVPERQQEFLRLAARQEDDLKVTDYELQDVQAGSDKAVVQSRVTWYRQSTLVTKSELMAVLWERKGNTWMIGSIMGGPLPLPPR